MLFLQFTALFMAVLAANMKGIQNGGSVESIPMSNKNCSTKSFLNIEPVRSSAEKLDNSVFAAAVESDIYQSTSQVRQWRVADCDNFSRQQMSMVLKYYPFVQVVCEEQGLLLYPSVLDQTPTGPQAKGGGLLFQSWTTTYHFKEFKIEIEGRETSLTLPLAHCITFSDEAGPATTEVRLTISAFFKGGAGLSGGVPIPFFGIESGFGTSVGTTGSVYINHACNRKTASVRPFISLKKYELTIRTREWKVKPNRRQFIVRQDWEENELTVLSRRAPVLSCVSELYVPDVCGWPSAPLEISAIQ